MMVGNLPLTVLVHIHKTITTLHFVSGRSHRKLVNSCILAPVVTNGHIALKDLALRLLLQKPYKVILNQVVAGAWNI